MRRRIVLLVFLLAAAPAAAQTDEVVRAALYLTGADSPEALASIPMLKQSDLAEKPEPLKMTETVRLIMICRL